MASLVRDPFLISAQHQSALTWLVAFPLPEEVLDDLSCTVLLRHLQHTSTQEGQEDYDGLLIRAML